MMRQVMVRNWWMLAVRGIAAIVFGIGVMLFPAIALTVLVLMWGVYALADGIFALVSGFQGRETNKNWWVTVLEGAVSVLAGIATFLWPTITALVLLYIIAAWAIVTGILEIATAIELRKEIEGEFWLALSGVASLVFGLFLVVFPPTEGILALLWLLSVYSIAFGVVLIMLSFRLRSMTDVSGQSGAQQPA